MVFFTDLSQYHRNLSFCDPTEKGTTMNFKTTMIAVLTPFWLTASLMAGGIEIGNQKLTGICKDDTMEIGTSENGNQYIQLELSESFMVKTSKTKDYRKKRCNVTYTVKLPADRQLEFIQMSVDGVYSLASEGDARLTVKHRVKDNKSVGSTFFFATDNNDKKRGGFNDRTGMISSKDLPTVYQKCGATIPLKTSIIASVSKTDVTTKGTSRIELDDAVTNGHHRLAKIADRACGSDDSEDDQEEDEDDQEDQDDDEDKDDDNQDDDDDFNEEDDQA